MLGAFLRLSHETAVLRFREPRYRYRASVWLRGDALGTSRQR